MRLGTTYSLEQIYKFAPRQSPQPAQSLKQLEGSDSDGSDISGNLATALSGLQQNLEKATTTTSSLNGEKLPPPNAARERKHHSTIVILTGGLDAAFMGHGDASPGDLASLIKPALPKNAGRGATVALAGIRGAGGISTEHLIQAWKLACAYTGARCHVSQSLDLAGLIN